MNSNVRRGMRLLVTTSCMWPFLLACNAGSTTGLRQALLIGFANRLARRMTTHNGYKTLSDPPTLAQLHPSTARIAADEDGLLPEWVIYHELISTAKVFLSRVGVAFPQWCS